MYERICAAFMVIDLQQLLRSTNNKHSHTHTLESKHRYTMLENQRYETTGPV